MVIATYHSQERFPSRVGGNKNSVQRVAERALEYGICWKDTVGSLNKYLKSVYFNSDFMANNIRIYGNHVYVFRDNILITVLNLPHKFQAAVNKIRKRLGSGELCKINANITHATI